jgi:hypothetical protein
MYFGQFLNNVRRVAFIFSVLHFFYEAETGRGGVVIEALRYNPEGRGFDS